MRGSLTAESSDSGSAVQRSGGAPSERTHEAHDLMLPRLTSGALFVAVRDGRRVEWTTPYRAARGTMRAPGVWPGVRRGRSARERYVRGTCGRGGDPSRGR